VVDDNEVKAVNIEEVSVPECRIADREVIV
jgi:hypothetical protein